MGEAAQQERETAAGPLVLVVDDEASIGRTLEGVLGDEGYRTLVCRDGQAALELVQGLAPGERPDLIFLDIWMPGVDGLQVLRQLQQLAPSIPVVMISGHATIATALEATKIGAADFIEKPLDLNAILATVQRLVNTRSETGGRDAERMPRPSEARLRVEDSADLSKLDPIVFRLEGLSGNTVPQRTLAGSFVLHGQGLHTGKKSGLMLEPLPANSGIHFMSMGGSQIVPAHVDFVESTGFATTVRLGQTQAGTIEHLMSALHAYGITNLLVKCNGEVPVMDGSALEFCNLIEETGLEEQAGVWPAITVNETVRVGDGAEFIQIEPADQFVIDYTLQYPAPLGEQKFSFVLDDIEQYKSLIAPARTFGFVKDIEYLQKQGLALGGRFDNFVLFGQDGPINCALRFPDEPVRHKILDCIGDLYLLGRRICGKVTARMTGHSDNIALLKALRKRVKVVECV